MPTHDAKPLARRGWSEPVEPGIRRMHSTSCRSSADRKPGRNCPCPYRVSYTGANGRTAWRTLHGVTRAEARKARHKLHAEERSAPGPVAEDAPKTLHDLAKRYLRAKEGTLKPSTLKGTVEAYRLRVHPRLGALPLRGITRERIKNFIADLARDGCSRSQILKALRALSVMLTEAVEWKYLGENPALGIRLPKAPPSEEVQRVLDADQLRALFAYASRRRDHEAMLRLAGESGLRSGEIVGLHWGDIDFQAREVRVARSVWEARGSGGKPPVKHVGLPKSGKPRTVAITKGAAAVLGRWFEVAVTHGHGADSEPVFRGRNARYVSSVTPAQILKRSLLALGLVAEDGKPLCALHGLRHTAASLMIVKGVDVVAVSRQLGHSKVSTTLNIYAHLIGDDALHRAVSVFDEPGDVAGDVAGDSPAEPAPDGIG